MQDIICAICGINQQKRLLYQPNFKTADLTSKIFSARRNPDRIHYQLNECQKCGLIFSSPIFSQAKIEKLYKNSFCAYGKQINYLNKTYFTLFEKVSHRLSKNSKILEIGCGDGFFLKELYKNGFTNLYGIEPGQKMVAKIPSYIRKNVKASILKKEIFPNERFDFICCFHTLDHVIDPKEFLNKTYKLLEKKGIVIFVVHDAGSFSVKIFGEKSPIF